MGAERGREGEVGGGEGEGEGEEVKEVVMVVVRCDVCFNKTFLARFPILIIIKQR